MSEHLTPVAADRMRRAESRWLEQSRERLRQPRHPRRTPPATAPSNTPQPASPEETDR